MKIALAFNESLKTTLFTDKAYERIQTLGEVVLNEGDATVESIKKTVKDADIVVTSWGTPALTKEILDECPNAKLVIHAAGSVKPIVTDELWARGIRVCASTRPLGIGVAETALGLTIATLKNFFELNDDLHSTAFRIRNVTDLYDINIGVVSAGFVGRHYIKLLNNFGVNIMLYDPFVTEEKAKEMGAKKVDFETLLKESDLVSLHAPSIPETYHIINEETLKLMKKDAILINTARGSLIDENALYNHVVAGNLKYVCLDVYDPEPLPEDSKLRRPKNIILTPHIAGLATNGKLRIGSHVCDEIENFNSNSPLYCEVKKEMLSKMA